MARDHQVKVQDHQVTADSLIFYQQQCPTKRSRTPRTAFLFFLLFLSIFYIFHSQNILPTSSLPHILSSTHITITTSSNTLNTTSQPTDLQHIVFGIAAAAGLWDKRKAYLKSWWRPHEMLGFVWLDDPVDTATDDHLLPPIRISSDTSNFPYSHPTGDRSAIRITRIVSETLRSNAFKDLNIRWLVMCDDDTVFVPDNLVRVLNKYDHRQFYYIGSVSESHLQNIYFSYNMAYGGGGFAISYPLAVDLERMQDQCVMKYPNLYGSDDRMHACMAELGVPLTREPGFHQFDIYGDPFGLLAAHPVTPLVSLHHLDLFEPVFPNMTSADAVNRLFEPTRFDSAAIAQQSICYVEGKWTVSVSWGFAVQVIRGVVTPREMELPARTFQNWYPSADYKGFSFNTRALFRQPCQKPFVYYFSTVQYDRDSERTVTDYVRQKSEVPQCKWKMESPEYIERVVVYKKPDPSLWNKVSNLNGLMVFYTCDF
ncbi:hypothetical protein QJS04_geneDACA023422 [Acorus gramineus]|uniref:Uncharacterized protein n=1 Tax=Acorus gramineus TaxID=55184 RepID=A0AAV9AE07_ACOGR|nr:hypothetical protein QJS04_geneDACA023422 [Acorus gramineus]